MDSHHPPQGQMWNDWQARKSVIDCNRHMLSEQDGCDIFFRVGEDGQLIGAHKYVLTSRSCVFYAMFRGPMSETRPEIDVPDISPDIFMILLCFLYCGEISIDYDTVMAVLYAAKKYQVQELIDACLHFVDNNMAPQNACLIMEQAHVFGEPELQDKSFKIILQNGDEAMSSPEVTDLCKSCLTKLVSCDQLDVDETIVVEVALRWATRQCELRGMENTGYNKRKVLGSLLYLIRFPLLRQEYFARIVCPTGVLSAEENSAIGTKIRMPESKIDLFSDKRRIRMHTETYSCLRIAYCLGDKRYRIANKGTDKAVAFRTNQNIYLCGFTVCRPLRNTAYQFHIRLWFYDNEDNLIHRHTTVLHNKVDVIFMKRLKVVKNVWHTLVINVTGPDAGSGYGVKAVTCQGVVFQFKESSRSKETDGQIPELLFSIAK